MSWCDVSCVCSRVLIFFSYKSISYVGLRLALMTSFNLITFLKTLCANTVIFWDTRVRTWTYELGRRGHSSALNTWSVFKRAWAVWAGEYCLHGHSLFIQPLFQVSAFLILVLCLAWPSVHVHSVSRSCIPPGTWSLKVEASSHWGGSPLCSRKCSVCSAWTSYVGKKPNKRKTLQIFYHLYLPYAFQHLHRSWCWY